MIINLTKNKIVANNPQIALSFIERGRGMIGRKFDDFDAMIFNGCNSIHTMFMSSEIDVIFVDKNNKICDLRKRVKPWRPFIRSGHALSVIELPPGVIEKTETVVGDVLNLNAETVKGAEEKSKDPILPVAEAVISMSANEES